MDIMKLDDIWNNWGDADSFSGVFSVNGEQGVVFEKCCGYRNRSENLPNNSKTAFGIASGTKLFTGLAVCKLIDEGKLSLGSKLWRAIFSHGILSAEMTRLFLTPQVKMRPDPKHSGYYGLGVYIKSDEDGSSTLYAEGGDFGVEFFTAYFPKQKIVASALANTEVKLCSLLRALL